MLYELVGGPLDGEDIHCDDEHMRVGIPYECGNGCCQFYELYDWTEKSDEKRQLFYAGRQAIERHVYDWAYENVDDGELPVEYVIEEAPILMMGNSVDENELWEMWETESNVEGDDE